MRLSAKSMAKVRVWMHCSSERYKEVIAHLIASEADGWPALVRWRSGIPRKIHLGEERLGNNTKVQSTSSSTRRMAMLAASCLRGDAAQHALLAFSGSNRTSGAYDLGGPCAPALAT